MLKKISLAALLLILIPMFHLSASEIHPLEPADTSSPRATYGYFIEQMNIAYAAHLQSSYHDVEVKNTVLKAMKCLDLSEVAKADRENIGIETALLLKEVIDRIATPPLDQIPDVALVKNKEIDLYVLPHTDIRIQKISDGPRKGEFLFNSQTVEETMEFYNRVNHLPYKPGASVDA